jgi:hypothetical protein
VSARPLGLICVFSASSCFGRFWLRWGWVDADPDDHLTRTRTTTVTVAQQTCGDGVKVPAGNKGGRHGGTYYPDVKGGPIVSLAGGRTSCEALLALADAYATKEGPALTSWLRKNRWTWMNTDRRPTIT